MRDSGKGGGDANEPEGVPIVPGTPGAPQKSRANGSDITSGDVEFTWRHEDLPASLEGLRLYVLATAKRSERWYWKNKKTKALLAVAIQWIAILATGIAGLVPIVAKLTSIPVDSGLLASVLIGGGAALLTIDRVAGISSGWTRYVLTATAIRTASEEFRIDWAGLSAQATTPPTAEQSGAMIQRAKTFSMAIETLITKETQDWAMEFRQNMSMLERDLKLQVEQAKVERDKAEQDAKAKAEQEKATRHRDAQPGSLEASVPNANTTDGFSFQARLENKSGLVVDEPVVGSESWTQLALPAGSYKLTISGLVKKQKVSSSTVLLVKPGETTKSQLSLPAASPAATAPPP